MEVNEEAAPEITPNTEELPPVEMKEVKKEEEDECLDDDIFEETSASAAAPIELDIKKEVDEAILALKWYHHFLSFRPALRLLFSPNSDLGKAHFLDCSALGIEWEGQFNMVQYCWTG